MWRVARVTRRLLPADETDWLYLWAGGFALEGLKTWVGWGELANDATGGARVTILVLSRSLAVFYGAFAVALVCRSRWAWRVRWLALAQPLASVALGTAGVLLGLASIILELAPGAGRIAGGGAFFAVTGLWAVPCAVWLQRRPALFRSHGLSGPSKASMADQVKRFELLVLRPLWVAAAAATVFLLATGRWLWLAGAVRKWQTINAPIWGSRRYAA